MITLISAEDNWTLLAVLLGSGAFGLWAERTRWGSKLSGAVIAIGTAFVLSNLRVIPAQAPIYGMVWSYLVPLAIPLLLFSADLKRILREAGPTLLAFAAGAVGTVAGTWIAFQVVPLGEHGWRLAGIFCATYVGGSLNYMAAAEALGLRSGDFVWNSRLRDGGLHWGGCGSLAALTRLRKNSSILSSSDSNERTSESCRLSSRPPRSPLVAERTRTRRR